MDSQEISDVDIKNSKANVAGGDINTTKVGDTTIGQIFNSITPISIPSNDEDEKLIASLENNRKLLQKSKLTLLDLIMEEPKNYKSITTAIKNIKMSGDNINNLINVLSVRGQLCEHLPDEDNYEYDILRILDIKNEMLKKFGGYDCPHCKTQMNIKSKLGKITLLKKPEKIFYFIDKCQKTNSIDSMYVQEITSQYCKSCKNLVCIYYINLNDALNVYKRKHF